jgi:hypothetical protein
MPSCIMALQDAHMVKSTELGIAQMDDNSSSLIQVGAVPDPPRLMLHEPGPASPNARMCRAGLTMDRMG